MTSNLLFVEHLYYEQKTPRWKDKDLGFFRNEISLEAASGAQLTSFPAAGIIQLI